MKKRVDTVEPPPPPQIYLVRGETVSLILRLLKMLQRIGKIYVLASGLYVLQGLVDMNERILYEAALIKKRSFWPRYIDGEISMHTSSTRLLRMWMHFLVSLTMLLFMSSL